MPAIGKSLNIYHRIFTQWWRIKTRRLMYRGKKEFAKARPRGSCLPSRASSPSTYSPLYPKPKLSTAFITGTSGHLNTILLEGDRESQRLRRRRDRGRVERPRVFRENVRPCLRANLTKAILTLCAQGQIISDKRTEWDKHPIVLEWLWSMGNSIEVAMETSASHCNCSGALFFK